jgi:hypothetical protein
VASFLDYFHEVPVFSLLLAAHLAIDCGCHPATGICHGTALAFYSW